MLRTTLAQGAQQPVTNQPRQIVLPSGQTVIPKQPDAAAAAKNVVLGQLNSSVPPVIVSSKSDSNVCISIFSRVMFLYNPLICTAAF